MLPPALALILLVFCAGVPGALALRLWRRLATDAVEFVFIAITLGVMLLGWFALLLAELNRFSLLAMAVLWAMTTGILLIIWLVRRRGTEPAVVMAPRQSRWEWIGLGLWLVAASVVYFRPHEFVIGGADAGVYVSLGANIAKTGGILIHDPLLGQLDPGLRPALLRTMPAGEAAPYYILPGFYVTGSPADLITPQFFHLHPVWQAVGYALGDLPAELLITPLWGILGCLAVYMTVRALWGWQPAMLALVALSATALQVWFARYPTAEVLTQYFFWTGAWALAQWLDRREPDGLWALLAGLAFGEVFLTRIDTYVLLALPVILVIWFTVMRSWRRTSIWFFVPLTLLTLHSVLHGLLVTRPYFSLITQVGVGLLLPGLLSFLSAGVLIGLAWTVWPRQKRRFWAGTGQAVADFVPVVLRVCAALVVVLALFAYFIRPHLSEVRLFSYWYGGGEIPALDQQNFVRLGWYLSPLGLALSVAGTACLIVREINRKTAFLVIAGGIFSVVFLWQISANPHQIYAMRRYVPQVAPFFIVTATYLLMILHRKVTARWRWSVVVLTLAWIAAIVVSARAFVRQVDYRGVLSQIARVDASLPAASVLVFNDTAPVGVGDFLGTPLRFLFGHEVLIVRDAAQLDGPLWEMTVRSWLDSGRSVFWIDTEGGHSWSAQTLSLAPPEEYVVETDMLEGTYDRRPSAVVPLIWRFSMARIVARAAQ